MGVPELLSVVTIQCRGVRYNIFNDEDLIFFTCIMYFFSFFSLFFLFFRSLFLDVKKYLPQSLNEKVQMTSLSSPLHLHMHLHSPSDIAPALTLTSL